MQKLLLIQPAGPVHEFEIRDGGLFPVGGTIMRMEVVDTEAPLGEWRDVGHPLIRRVRLSTESGGPQDSPFVDYELRDSVQLAAAKAPGIYDYWMGYSDSPFPDRAISDASAYPGARWQDNGGDPVQPVAARFLRLQTRWRGSRLQEAPYLQLVPASGAPAPAPQPGPSPAPAPKRAWTREEMMNAPGGGVIVAWFPQIHGREVTGEEFDAWLPRVARSPNIIAEIDEAAKRGSSFPL